MRAGRFARVDLEIRQVGGARDAVVHERAGRELARGVVLAAFGERLADALREAAMHLAVDDHRIDDLAEIVHRHPFLDLHLAGFRIDLDLADVAAGREGEIGRVVEGVLVQARLELVVRVVVRHIGREGHLAEHFFLVGALDGIGAILELDVAFRRFQQMRGDLLAFGDDLVERFHDRRPSDCDGP